MNYEICDKQSKVHVALNRDTVSLTFSETAMYSKYETCGNINNTKLTQIYNDAHFSENKTDRSLQLIL